MSSDLKRSLQKTIIELKKASLINDAESAFLQFLMRQEPTIKEAVLMAAWCVMRAFREGDVCVSLAQIAGTTLFADTAHAIQLPPKNQFETQLRQSSLVGDGSQFRPLVCTNGRLYLHKLWQNEDRLAQAIQQRAARVTPIKEATHMQLVLERLFPAAENTHAEPDWQKIAACSALINNLTIISGGPGTGKTFTVVRLLALLLEQARKQRHQPVIALAAPTGKAAARLEESVSKARASLPLDERVREGIPETASTIHRLLGARRQSVHFKYNAENPLPHDIVIVDEASMVDQALMSRLMDAIRTEAKVILLGDKDQLASVEAGAVLGDIWGEKSDNRFTLERQKSLQQVMPKASFASFKGGDEARQLDNCMILLQKSYRFNSSSGIGRLCQAINGGAADEAIELLHNSTCNGIHFSQPASYEGLIAQLCDFILPLVQQAPDFASPEEGLATYSRLRILAAHRNGPWGVGYLNGRIEQQAAAKGVISRLQPWYAGKPIIINENAYGLGLSNGDLGLCLRDEQDHLKVYFQGEEGLIGFWPARLPAHSTAYALTVHKSQGSEFEQVSLVLPHEQSKILNRQLIYTAASRAREHLHIYGTEDVLRVGIQTNYERQSGLQSKLWQAGNS